MIPTVAILAGGFATRLYPITKNIPKALIKVNGKPFIFHQLKLLKSKGIKKVVICAGFLGKNIKSYLNDNNNFGLDIKYSFDGNKLLGTGGAIKKALNLLGNSFYVLYGDSYTDVNFKNIYSVFCKNKKKGLMVIIENNNQWDKSNIQYKNGIIKKYDKKGSASTMKHIDYGLSLLKKDSFDYIKTKQKFDLADLYRKLVKNNEMYGYEVSNRFYEIGSFEGINQASNYIRRSTK